MKCTSQKMADLIRIFRIYICFSCSYSEFSSTFTLNAHFFVFIFRNWIFRLHCLGVSSLLFDELARSSSRLLLALYTFCLYIVIIRMPMSFLHVHLCCINVPLCIMYQSMRVCTYIYLTYNIQTRLNPGVAWPCARQSKNSYPDPIRFPPATAPTPFPLLAR